MSGERSVCSAMLSLYFFVANLEFTFPLPCPPGRYWDNKNMEEPLSLSLSLSLFRSAETK